MSAEPRFRRTNAEWWDLISYVPAGEPIALTTGECRFIADQILGEVADIIELGGHRVVEVAAW